MFWQIVVIGSWTICPEYVSLKIRIKNRIKYFFSNKKSRYLVKSVSRQYEILYWARGAMYNFVPAIFEWRLYKLLTGGTGVYKSPGGAGQRQASDMDPRAR